MIEEFNVHLKAECDQLPHETKQTNASAHLVQYRFKIREGRPEWIRRLWRKGFVKEMSFKALISVSLALSQIPAEFQDRE